MTAKPDVNPGDLVPGSGYIDTPDFDADAIVAAILGGGE